MRLPIPQSLRDAIDREPFFKSCALWESKCEGRIEIHHAFTYGGRRQNVIWGLLPLCHYHHEKEAQHRQALKEVMRDRLVHYKQEEEAYRIYPKSDLFQ